MRWLYLLLFALLALAPTSCTPSAQAGYHNGGYYQSTPPTSGGGGGGGEAWTKLTASMLTAYRDTSSFVLSGPTGGTSGIAAGVRNTGAAVNYAMQNTACYEIDTTAAGLDLFDVDTRGGIECAFDHHTTDGAQGLGVACGVLQQTIGSGIAAGISRNTGASGVFEVQSNFWNGGSLGSGTSTTTEADYSQYAYAQVLWETEFSATPSAQTAVAQWADATGSASGLYESREVAQDMTDTAVPVLCYTQRTSTDQGASETIDISVWVRDYDATEPS